MHELPFHSPRLKSRGGWVPATRGCKGPTPKTREFQEPRKLLGKRESERGRDAKTSGSRSPEPGRLLRRLRAHEDGSFERACSAVPPPEVSDRNHPVGEVSPGLGTHGSDLLSPPSTQSLRLYFGIAAAPRRPGAGTAEESRGKVELKLGVRRTLCPPTSRGAAVSMVTRAARYVTAAGGAGRGVALGRPAAARGRRREWRARRRSGGRCVVHGGAAREPAPKPAPRGRRTRLFVGRAERPRPRRAARSHGGYAVFPACMDAVEAAETVRGAGRGRDCGEPRCGKPSRLLPRTPRSLSVAERPLSRHGPAFCLRRRRREASRACLPFSECENSENRNAWPLTSWSNGR